MPAPPREQRELEPERPVGPHQVCAVEDLLDQLRVQLYARNLLAERRRLVVEESHPRDAEEHELRAQELRVGLAGEEVRGGHEARRVVPAVAQPHRAVPLHRNRRAGELHAQQAVARVAQRELVRAGPDAPELERERRNRRVADAGHQRHAAHQALRHVDADEAAPGGCAVDLGHTREELPILAQRRRAARLALLQAGHGEHHLVVLDREREPGVVARQALQALRQLFGQRHEARNLGGREAVGLGEQQVESDRRGLVLGDARGELRDKRTRPGPLPVFGERLLVDLDDRRRGADPLARQHALVGVEERLAHRLDRRGRPSDEREQQGDERGRGGARAGQRSISIPS